MTTEDTLAETLFKSGMSFIRTAVEHAKKETADPTQAEFFQRELDKESRKLGARLQALDKNRLPNNTVQD